MKTIEITLNTNPFTNSASQIAKFEALGVPASLLYKEQSRTQMVREALVTRTELLWASKFEGDTEFQYFQGVYSAQTRNILDDLQARGVILSHREVKLP